jgi:hypothetical protein
MKRNRGTVIASGPSGIGPPPPAWKETSPPRIGAERIPTSHSAGTMVLSSCFGSLEIPKADCDVRC